MDWRQVDDHNANQIRLFVSTTQGGAKYLLHVEPLKLTQMSAL